MASTVVEPAGRAETPPRPVDPSSSSVDRNDSSNSSPNLFADAEIQVLFFLLCSWNTRPVHCICDSSTRFNRYCLVSFYQFIGTFIYLFILLFFLKFYFAIFSLSMKLFEMVPFCRGFS